MHNNNFNNVNDFLNELLNGGVLLRKDSPMESWIYRGQACKQWDLIASALRDGVKLLTNLYSWGDENEHGKADSEVRTLLQFFASADEHGRLKGIDSLSIRSFFRRWLSGDEELRNNVNDPLFWPPEMLLPLCALGQHHGIPTRLLDFTRSPFIAAYFAANDAVERGIRGDVCDCEYLSVWAFDLEILKHYDNRNEHCIPIEVVTTPGFGNYNLVLQKSLFILTRSITPLNRLPFHNWTGEDYNPSVYRQVNLKISEAGKLLKVLYEKYQISGSTLFDGIDGVVRGLRERDYWR